MDCSWGGKRTDWPRYDVARGSTPIVEFSSDGRILKAQSVIIDTIDGVQFDPWCHRSSENKQGSQSRSKACAFPNSREIFEVLYRTIVADTNRLEASYDPVQAPDEFGILFARFCFESDQILEGLQEPRGFIPTEAQQGSSNIEKRWHAMRHLKLGNLLLRDVVTEAHMSFLGNENISNSTARKPLNQHPLWQPFEHSHGQAMYHRRLFTTGFGYIGIGPRTLALGDRICVLLGCAVPLIIRTVGDLHQLIGECYIHGMMNGEAIKLVDKGDAQLTWISL